jgi:hypothetical protein
LTPQEFEITKRLGAFATMLLADATFLDVLKALKEDAIFCWTHGKSADEREAFWRDLQAVGRLQGKLETLGQNYRNEMANIEARKVAQARVNIQREAMDRG